MIKMISSFAILVVRFYCVNLRKAWMPFESLRDGLACLYNKTEPRKSQKSPIINSLLLLLLLLTGCTPHPPRPASDLVAPKTLRSGVTLATHQPDLRQMHWWEKMHDPVLNKLICVALANNNQLLTAQANVLQAQAQLKEARFAWLPTLNAYGNGFTGGGWDSEFTPQGPLAHNPAFARTGAIHFRGYFGGFVPQYTLNFLQNVYQNKAANATLTIQNANYQSARLSVISQVTGAYFMLLGQRQQLHDQIHYLHDLKKVRQLEWARFKDGASDLSTVISLDSQIATNEANVRSLENSLAQVENSLQILLNRNPGPLVSHSSLKNLSIHGLVPSHLPSLVLKNRPDILVAEQNFKISEANLGTAYSQFFPKISLTSLLGNSSIELSHLLTLSTGLWVLQGAASLPVLNGVTYEQIKEAKAGYLAAYYTYVQTLRSAFADVDNSLTNQQKVNAQYSNQLQALAAAKKSYALALARYKAGAKDYRDVANAALTVDTATLNVTLAKMQQMDAIVGVYQSVAAGYV
jgi:NodT family efflux transporter outer membrane factor (OMF) lipoprotein